MLAAKKTGPGTAAVTSVPVPDPGPADVLVRVRACAVCASDLWGWRAPVAGPGTPGEWDPDNAGITGHEIAGEIVAVGSEADEGRLGEAVWIDPITGCGSCPYCREGRQTFCADVSIVCQGFAEFVRAPTRQCRPIPDGFDYTRASMIADMVGTPTGAVRRAAVGAADAVAVWGLGPVGLGLVQASLIAGASAVIGIDPVPSRRARAERLGAATVAAAAPGAVADELLSLTSGRGPDVALCSVAADGAAQAAFETLRLDGRMVTVAGTVPAGGEERKWVSGSWACDERLWPEVIEQLTSGRFSLEGYVTHVFPLSRIEEAFAVRADELDSSFKVVVTPD
jgi:threonine dehydrogenase-like Zn-dependent dehydrogenase